MIGFFRRRDQPQEPAPPDFKRLMADAVRLRESVSEKVACLSREETISFICCLRDISREMQSRHAIPPETLSFGTLRRLSTEQTSKVVEELGDIFNEAERNGNEVLGFAVAWCQSMAMACLAGSLAQGAQQERDFIKLKHRLGQQTGTVVDSL